MKRNITMNDENLLKIVQLMETDDSVDAPADSILWCKNIFRARAAEKQPGILERIVATLASELSANKPAFGERSGSAGHSRQMLFEAGDNSVDLRISESEGLFRIRGQILGEGIEKAEVEFAGQKVLLDEFGAFLFEDIGSGDYEMTIRTEGREITLRGIELR